MKDFDDDIKTNITQNNITIRDHTAETKWTSRQIDQFIKKQTTDKPEKLHINLASNNLGEI